MEKETKILLGKILGEIYRIEKRLPEMACPATQGQIYGLLNGFENSIDDELEMTGFVPKEHVEIVGQVLDEIWLDKEKLNSFKGFYDIERKLSSMGVDRGQANKILRYFSADDRFVEIIEKMDTSDSPSESRRFNLSEFDK